MSWRNGDDRYGSLSIGLHWFMLLLLAAVYACIELHEFFPRGSDTRSALQTWHFMLGLSVLILVSLRLLAKLLGPHPRIEPQPPGWQMGLARLMHLLLYALMFGMPVAGWLILSADGHAIPFFGLHLPPLIGENEDLAKLIEEWHKTGGNTGYFLVGLHALSGLFHHYVVKDNTLKRMLPKHDLA